jgi:hypothetical protein
MLDCKYESIEEMSQRWQQEVQGRPTGEVYDLLVNLLAWVLINGNNKQMALAVADAVYAILKDAINKREWSAAESKTPWN